VPGPHNFVANEIIAHNSIEQDADVVAFIHRESVYTSRDDWEKRNPTDRYPERTAEIIVAKHRNGPLGTVPLEFYNDVVRFEGAQRAQQAVEYA
jgi:replicative DNA helicase